jgi:protein phosphatase
MSTPKVRTQTDVVQAEQPRSSAEPCPQLAAQCFGCTDRGQRRETNEDQFLIAELVKSLNVLQTSLPEPQQQHAHDRSYLLIVADGVGGAQAGEAASAMAVQTMEHFVLDTLHWFAHCHGDDDQQVIAEFRQALGQAHGRLRAASLEKPELRGMGTTLTLAYSVNDELFVAHVGDSRCYLMRDQALYRITHDHTLVEEMVERGVIKPEEVATHRWRHVITSTVGGDSPSVRVDVHKLQLQAGDRLLLCSDGLTEMLSKEQLAHLLALEETPEVVCRKLIALANELGGRDNVTVIVADFALVLSE